MPLSVIVITMNADASIGDCLASVTWADEIIVVDSGSTDGTVEICRRYTDHVHVADWPGFGPQKNRALALATRPWVLSLDADERISPELRREMEAAMADPGGRVAFAMPRRSSFCGKPMRHSGWWPDYVTRLFRRGDARFSGDLVHERVIADGPVGRLREPLLHEAFGGLEEVLEKMNRYSTAGARMMHDRGKRATLTTAILHGLWSFFQTYIIRAGFLDGRKGFMLAVSNAEGTYYRYLKLLLLAEKGSIKIAVVVTTYNRPDALAAVLDGYLAQRDRGFEIVVADDGSGAETAAAVKACREKAGLAVHHVWQEDRGFRAGAARNRALGLTQADYVIFTDGDCLPLPGFVAGHRRLAERGWFVTGNRVLSGEKLSRRILAERLPAQAWPTGRWLFRFLKGEINRWLPLWSLPVPGWLRKLPARRWHGVMTCNLAVWREDLLAVNGFDESYEGWGLEDSDLTLRLLHSGLRRKSARFAAPLVHLWHPANDRTALEENRRRLDALICSGRIRAERGVSQHL